MSKDEQEMKQQLHQQHMRDHAKFIHQATEAGMMIPCHTMPVMQDRLQQGR